MLANMRLESVVLEWTNEVTLRNGHDMPEEAVPQRHAERGCGRVSGHGGGGCG